MPLLLFSRDMSHAWEKAQSFEPGFPETEAGGFSVQQRPARAVSQRRLKGVKRRVIRLPEFDACERGRERDCGGDEPWQADVCSRQVKSGGGNRGVARPGWRTRS